MTLLHGLDQDACYRAASARDARFDGRFFGCVKTTGIYCRPVCPARTPRRENMIFVPTAAAAETLGFRACLRCRPETAPDMGAWRGTSNTVSRAARASTSSPSSAPVSVAQTRRVLLAKQLIHDTDLGMAEVALASGFGSVRRFNETFQALYGRPPSALRRRGERAVDAKTGVRLSLAYREPYDWDAMMAALAARGDIIVEGDWRRTLESAVDGSGGWITVRPLKGRLALTVSLTDLTALPGVLARVRRVFDLAADPAAIAGDLSRDPVLAPLLNERPGLRLPGLWVDPQADDPPNDRLADSTLAPWAEAWRPWRAYAELHLNTAGVTAEALKRMETDHDRRAA